MGLLAELYLMAIYNDRKMSIGWNVMTQGAIEC